jgi:hypothetical protein
VSFRRQEETVLARWRQVERDLARTELGSAEAESLQSEAARLRDEYCG